MKIRYTLEMTSPDQFRPKPSDAAELSIVRAEVPLPELNHWLHQAVGGRWRWGGREGWGEWEWRQYVERPELETWIAYLSGTPAGYYELEAQGDGSMRIQCFGLLEPFIGRRIGAAFLSHAIRRGWERGANRIWLVTCNWDHPHALGNYLSRGFRVARVGPAYPTTSAQP